VSLSVDRYFFPTRPMYNNCLETIPLKTPVHLQVVLLPWFDNKCLQEGLDLIREETIQHFFFYRYSAAALFEHSKPFSIIFAETKSIKQGFTLKEHSCSICGQKAAKKRCPHLAALTILSLTARDKNERDLFPMPLHFDKTGWYQIGSFLYGWLSRQSGNTLYNISTDTFQLKKETEQGGITVRLPLHMASQWRAFFDASHTADKELGTLRESIKEQTFTATETQLFACNSETRGSKRDSSIWLWICRYFALQENDTLPTLQHDSDKKILVLTIRQDATEFILSLPKNRTWELLSSLRNLGLDVNILPPAQECFQVHFLPSGIMQVIPSLRLSDNRQVPSSTLEEQKMGSHYFLPGEGFLPVKKLDQLGVITHPDNNGQLNLFDFAQRSQEQTQTFIVEPNRIHEFLEHNRDALQHPDNCVEQNILEITTTLLPQELVIDKFSEDNDWCYLSCHYGMGNATISLEEILEAATAKSDYIPGQQWLQLSDSPLSWLHDLLPERLIRAKNGSESVLRLRHSELMALTGLVPEVRNNVSRKDFRKQLNELLDCTSWSDESLLPDCPVHLRDYQRTGLAWLNSLYRFGLGGLLADDMGLGKTHQGLALLDLVQKQKHTQNEPKQSAQLVICPASVLFHWKNKIDEFYPQISYTIYYGPDRILDTTVNPGLLITTYAIARIDQDLLAAIPFDIILLDEIHNLKNHKTAMHKAVAMLNSRVIIGLTGTPIENSLTDLHSLFSLCLPGFLGSTKNFAANFLIPIKEHKSKDAAERLRRLIHPFILRRDRKQVLTELPNLSIDDRTCELSDTQVKLYREAVDESQELLEDMELEGASVKYINILAMLTRLKQICNHPCLLEKSIDAKQYESGKWNLFTELLSECLAADLKIVVFSQYTGMLDIIEHYLKQTGIDYAFLRGNMAISRREKMLKKFSDEKECKVFCASLLAGGTGIDLIAAQVVIHYDRWWNPAKEAQATARVHRMGQKEQVQVFRLITVGTLEEKIHTLLKRKQEMSDSLISTDESGVIKKLDHNQLKELFRLDKY